MKKGGIGPSSKRRMFTTSTTKGSHTLPTSKIDSLKDMALALVLGLANINPPPPPIFDDTIQRMLGTLMRGGCYT
jgi:hypothetical protein